MGNPSMILDPEQDFMVCLFCGQKKKEVGNEYSPDYECDCKDAAFNRKIESKINRLRRMYRTPEWKIVNKIHIKRKDKYEVS